MSFRKERVSNFQQSDTVPKISYLDDLSKNEVDSLFRKVLESGVHGFCFSLYEEGQKPGDIIPKEQIRKRMKILKPYTGAIRSFSCIEGNELIPQVAKEYGLKTLVGAWLGRDKEKNQEEIAGLIQLAKNGFVDIAAVGNEVLYREDLNEDELLSYIRQVKSEIPEIPVGYVDAYYEFANRPNVTDSCDVILCNLYPFWEGTEFQHSLQHMRHMYSQVVDVANGKKVVIAETGWPSKGENMEGAVPNKMNAMSYFINTHLWAQENNIETFYFSSFDESWKVTSEGSVGAYWGIWDNNGKLKF